VTLPGPALIVRHLAVALEVNRFHQAGGAAPVTLVSADQALNDAALAKGLAVDDPHSHP
jgi:hypothetical protein